VHEGAQVWLRVTDNGPGIALAAQARIFEAFFTTKAEGMGTGMGLSVSRALAREHGGELMLEAAPGTFWKLGNSGNSGGATFLLTLPIADARALQPFTATLPGAVCDDVVDQSRVLVVDDEAELAGVMREMLETAGYEVSTAESGAVALELLDAARFDAVVSDLRMPDMDGALLWRHICERHPTLRGRLLFVTGDTLSPDAAEFLRVSGCEGLDKPFGKADLLAKVADLLQSAQVAAPDAFGR